MSTIVPHLFEHVPSFSYTSISTSKFKVPLNNLKLSSSDRALKDDHENV